MNDDLAERLRRLDHRYIAELVRERAQFVDHLDTLSRENERLRAEAAAADDVFLENEQLTDYGLDMLGRAMKAGHEREILRRQVAAVRALCEAYAMEPEQMPGFHPDLALMSTMRAFECVLAELT